MKKGLLCILYFLIVLNIIDNKLLDNTIYKFIYNAFDNIDYKLVFDTTSLDNENRYKEYSINTKNTTDFNVKDKSQILNVYYTVLNSGLDDFSFYCDDNYKDCVTDITSISNDSEQFSYLNSLIHPYNSFKTINSSIKSNNRVDVRIEKKYTKDDINKIDNKIIEITNNLNINNYDNVTDKIKVFHDYIANNSKYDKNKEQGVSTYKSDSAIGTLFEGFSVCSGYTDTMAIFLNKLGLDNVKIITQNHTWNAVKLNDTWYHIDLTWDDPINNLDRDILTHDYFMLTTDELLKKDLTEHDFDRNLYEFVK